MQDENKVLMLATFYKVMNGEPLTIQEVQRWGTVLTTPFDVASPNEQQIQELQFQIRQSLKQVYDIK